MTTVLDEEMWIPVVDLSASDEEAADMDAVPDEEADSTPPSGYVIGTGAGSMPDGGISTGGLPADGPQP
jgi:hypothetical protein